jgi:hypothetical protein
MKTKLTMFLIPFLFPLISVAQENDEIEIYIIDSYVTPEIPHTFNLSFYTSEAVKAKVLIDEKYKIDISTDFKEDHSMAIDFTNYHFSKKDIPFQIIVEDKRGNIIKGEENELTLPYDEFVETKEGHNPITTLVKGILLYLLPAPNLVIYNDEKYFGLTKEISLVTFYSSGYNYPTGNISLEYSHIYNSPIKDFLRVGYKHIIPINRIEFISPGLSLFTNFKGFNGISPELSIGLFKIYNVFTVYSRYRYNVQPTNATKQFHEISIGLYSNFFTFDL